MRFYEVKFLCPPGIDGKQLDEDARHVASLMSGAMEVHHTTVHARPSNDYPTRHDCAIFVSVPNERELYEYAGKMARLHGLAMAHYQLLGKGQDTLNYKAIEGNDELEEEAAREALGADDSFTITDIHDRADE